MRKYCIVTIKSFTLGDVMPYRTPLIYQNSIKKNQKITYLVKSYSHFGDQCHPDCYGEGRILDIDVVETSDPKGYEQMAVLMPRPLPEGFKGKKGRTCYLLLVEGPTGKQKYVEVYQSVWKKAETVKEMTLVPKESGGPQEQVRILERKLVLDSMLKEPVLFYKADRA